jgi:hypothetical protein
VRIVATPAAREVLEKRGAVYVAPRALRCCGGRQYDLVASVERPTDAPVELVHAAEGFQVWAREGLIQPNELHFELDRTGRLRAYWNGQAWIG